MSRGNVMNLTLTMTLDEADQALEAFHRKWQARFNISPSVTEPGATPAPGSTTFGGQTGGGNPQAWRANDPVTNQQLREPRIFGQPLTALPAPLQQAIAAQDPISAAYLASLQTGPRMTPADIRQAERLHQWGVRNVGYEQGQTVRAEERQHRDESYVDRQAARDYQREQRDQIRSEDKQHRDESYVDRRDFREYRSSQRERIQAENRQERDERGIVRESVAVERATFRASLAGQTPTAQAGLIAARMALVDPSSTEYQQLSGQLASAQRGTGLNRVIAPNHMYMQAMFAAMDVAGTVTHMAREQSLAQASGTVSEALQHQVGAVTGGGGILSQILKGGWDFAGVIIPGLNSPAKTEEIAIKEARRQQDYEHTRQYDVATRSSSLTTGGLVGTYAAKVGTTLAQGLNELAPLQLESQSLKQLMSLPDQDPLIQQGRQTMLGAINRRIQSVSAAGVWRLEGLEFERQQTFRSLVGEEGVFKEIATGGDQDDVARHSMLNRHTLEIKQAEREKDPDFTNAVLGRQRAETAAFDTTIKRNDQVRRIEAEGLGAQALSAGLGQTFESTIEGIKTQEDIGVASTSPLVRELSAKLAQNLRIGARLSLGRATGNVIGGNQSQIAVLTKLLDGDVLGAELETISARTNQRLNEGPQGLFRSLIEPSVRAAEAKEKEAATVRFRDERFLQKEQLESQRDVLGLEATGKDKSALVRRIVNDTSLAVDTATLAKRPDLQILAAQTGLEQAKVLQRQFRIAQFTEGSAQEAAPGTIGAGGTSTLPTSLEPETLQAGFDQVTKAITEMTQLLQTLTTD